MTKDLEEEKIVVENKSHNNNHNKHQPQHNQSFSYNVNLQYDPQIPIAGKSTKLSILITEQRSGDIIQKFETIHDKLMHIIIVDEGLSYFAHIHPIFDTTSSIFTIYHIFPESGKYKIWIDFKPNGGTQTLAAFKLNIIGNPVHKSIPIIKDRQYTKNIEGKYQISLKLPKEIKANNDIDIVFGISNTTGYPITDLQPLMGAGGHCVIISNNIREFLHVHPIKEVDANWKGGPDVYFRTNIPIPGLYKIWGQFQHLDELITADFILEVV